MTYRVVLLVRALHFFRRFENKVCNNCVMHVFFEDVQNLISIVKLLFYTLIFLPLRLVLAQKSRSS